MATIYNEAIPIIGGVPIQGMHRTLYGYLSNKPENFIVGIIWDIQNQKIYTRFKVEQNDMIKFLGKKLLASKNKILDSWYNSINKSIILNWENDSNLDNFLVLVSYQFQSDNKLDLKKNWNKEGF
jgi:hypothetical protein